MTASAPPLPTELQVEVTKSSISSAFGRNARGPARGVRALRPTDGIGVGRPQGLGRGILRMPADQSPVTFLPAGGPD
jgi:hypothetical protein